MTNAITRAQADIVCENLVVLTLTCANPSSAANVFASLKEELIAGRFRIGPYGIVDPKVERDERPTIETRVTMTEVDVVCHIDRRGTIRFDAACPDGHVEIARGPQSAILEALANNTAVEMGGPSDDPVCRLVGAQEDDQEAQKVAQALSVALTHGMIWAHRGAAE
ncbi:hypothetical protein HDIA_2242 [Hartmannibacter diazotrophicus]|uniref:Uncharacterized protein n=1 Tax=Hartmannibacter diazotrophicus TaxID=1482074 RepID=A0A2C9D6B1_9HYPH|nr:hypothetical protein [Hartmannibacter diazotrophicus]SON55783.1 hypothetical protein HDIA_2242 [Hartmannibacter diazotrophicus]